MFFFFFFVGDKMGVLSVKVGRDTTFVLNKQQPTRQIWYSSPLSGPWHYRYHVPTQSWVCTRDNHSLVSRLETELSSVLRRGAHGGEIHLK